MADRPIIFSAPMVRALRAGRKTQTRRLLRNVPPAPSDENLVHEPKHEHAYFDAYCGAKKTAANPRGMTEDWCWWTRDDRCGHGCKVRYVPGDRLYVREAWLTWGIFDDLKPSLLTGNEGITYLADATHSEPLPGRRRASMHMPRWASRLTLIVEDVRVERLQAISEADAVAEGMSEPSLRQLGGDLAQAAWSERQVFQRLWNHLHGAESWDANPWVVALTFSVQHGNIDRLAA